MVMAEVAYSMDEITAGTGGEAVAGRKDEHRLREAFDILAAGGTGALATIYELLSGELFAVALWRTGSQEDAADAVEFVPVWKRRFCTISAGAGAAHAGGSACGVPCAA